MKIEVLPLSKLKPYARNPRKIPQKAIDKVAASLLEFGWQQPIVVDKKRVIIVGHTRYLAALQLGWTEAPVHIAAKLTAAQANAYRLADNRTGEETGWNLELLGAEMMELKSMDFNLSLTGFNIGEIGRLLPASAEEPEAQMDRAEELQAKWKVERGQVWEIGKHRLMCGDFRDATEWISGKPELLLTDPPYGVGLEYGHEFLDSPENVRDLIKALAAWIPRFKCALITSGHRCLFDYPRPDWILAWIHPAGNGRGPWGFTTFNPVLAYGKDPLLSAGQGSHADSIVMAQDRQGELGHPVIKPIKVWNWLLHRGSAHENDTVVDCFAGSGTTFVAAEQTGRRCAGIEIEPKYCAVILERMTAMGLTPELANRIFSTV
jgi:site-specific DNA-methyltransferase (adenine-specific)